MRAALRDQTFVTLAVLVLLALAAGVTSIVLHATESPQVQRRVTVLRPHVAGPTPVLLVHGYSPNSCAGAHLDNYWAGWETLAAQLGGTGPLVRVGYYQCDTAADATIGTFDQNVAIETIAAALAWYVYDTYTLQDQDVDLVGHSMGGLVVREALRRVAALDPDFPPTLLVSHAETWSSPHDGVPSTVEKTTLGCSTNVTVECTEFLSGSAFLTALHQDPAPQVGAGTSWLAAGGGLCDIVTASSATDLPGGERVTWTTPCYQHTGVINDVKTLTNGVAKTWAPGDATSVVVRDEPHSVALGLAFLAG